MGNKGAKPEKGTAKPAGKPAGSGGGAKGGEYLFKLLLIGDSGVGKSALSLRLLSSFTPYFPSLRFPPLACGMYCILLCRCASRAKASSVPSLARFPFESHLPCYTRLVVAAIL